MRFRLDTYQKWLAVQQCCFYDITCFIDGSRIESYSQSGTGLFNYTDSKESSFPLSKFSSVFQAEFYAILQRAKLEGLLCRQNASIAIRSDSQAALTALASVKVTSGLVVGLEV